MPCSPTRTPTTTTSDPATTSSACTPAARPATTSAAWNASATKSPSRPSTPTPANSRPRPADNAQQLRPREAPPDAAACPARVPFSDQEITMGQERSAFRSRRRRGRRYGFALFAIALAMFAIGLPAAAQADSSQLQVTAMTYNLFQGSELTDAISATTPAALLAAVAKDFGQVQTTNFPERAQAIAAQAESASPDLIGLQEAALWQTGTPSASFPPPPATTVAFDFVKILVDALNAHGLHYAPVAVTGNFTVQAPGLFPFGFMNVRLTDRVAILARTDVPLTISNVQTANFTHNTVIQLFTGPFTNLGGWASVNATLGGHTVRFVTTHLDAISSAVRAAQATELVQGRLSPACRASPAARARAC